jgi:hypothetical protein
MAIIDDKLEQLRINACGRVLLEDGKLHPYQARFVDCSNINDETAQAHEQLQGETLSRYMAFKADGGDLLTALSRGGAAAADHQDCNCKKPKSLSKGK